MVVVVIIVRVGVVGVIVTNAMVAVDSGDGG